LNLESLSGNGGEKPALARLDEPWVQDLGLDPTVTVSWTRMSAGSEVSDVDYAAIRFSLANTMVSRKVCIGVLPLHHRPW